MLSNFKLSTQIIKAPLSALAFAPKGEKHFIKSSFKEHTENLWKIYTAQTFKSLLFVYARRIIEMRINSTRNIFPDFVLSKKQRECKFSRVEIFLRSLKFDKWKA